MTKSLGQGAWEVYANAVGQTTFDNKPLPGWAELGERQREGWEAAALAVLNKKSEEGGGTEAARGDEGVYAHSV